MRELDHQPKEGPLPFWLKALAIVMLVPFINSVVPGSIVAVFTAMGMPDPAEHQKKEQPTIITTPARVRPYVSQFDE